MKVNKAIEQSTTIGPSPAAASEITKRTTIESVMQVDQTRANVTTAPSESLEKATKSNELTSDRNSTSVSNKPKNETIQSVTISPDNSLNSTDLNELNATVSSSDQQTKVVNVHKNHNLTGQSSMTTVSGEISDQIKDGDPSAVLTPKATPPLDVESSNRTTGSNDTNIASSPSSKFNEKPCFKKLNNQNEDYVDEMQHAIISDRQKYFRGRNLATHQQQSKFLIDFLGWVCIAAFGFIIGILIGLMVFSSN